MLNWKKFAIVFPTCFFVNACGSIDEEESSQMKGYILGDASHFQVAQTLAQGLVCPLIRNGWSESSINEALCIINYESTFHADASNSSSAGIAMGYFQIMDFHVNASNGACSGMGDLYNTDVNFACAKRLYGNGNWGPWSAKKHCTQEYPFIDEATIRCSDEGAVVITLTTKEENQPKSSSGRPNETRSPPKIKIPKVKINIKEELESSSTKRSKGRPSRKPISRPDQPQTSEKKSGKDSLKNSAKKSVNKTAPKPTPRPSKPEARPPINKIEISPKRTSKKPAPKPAGLVKKKADSEEDGETLAEKLAKKNEKNPGKVRSARAHLY